MTTYSPPQSPVLDGLGLLFQTPTGEINIFGISTGYEFGVFTGADNADCNGGCTYTNYFGPDSSLALMAAPEPTSVVLLATILLAAALSTGKRWLSSRRANG
jgi:hypothetical protein